MTSFDYLAVLLSIVLGLAMTNVLTRLALVMQARERVNFYWPPIAWAVWLFFISVQHWWAQWSVRHSPMSSFGLFWLQLLTPVCIFLLSALALPDREEHGKVDLEDWYFRNRRWFFGVLFLVPILSIVEELVRLHQFYSVLNTAFLVAFDVAAVVAFFVTSRRAGEWIAALVMVMTLAYVGLLYLNLPGQ
jgi:hypothetical protein